MGCAIGSLLASVDLHHARDIQRVHSREGIRCNQHDTRVCVDFLLQIAQLDGLEHCMLSVWLDGFPLGAAVCVPAGSFKWDRLVKSSLASSMAGFISGGRLGSLPVCTADRVVSIVFFCVVHCQRLLYNVPAAVCRLPAAICSLLSALCRLHSAIAYLAILQLEDELDLVALNLLVDKLRGHPAVGRVGLPGPGAIFVDVCHVGRRVPRPLSLCGSASQGPRVPASGSGRRPSSRMSVRPLVVRCSACKFAAFTADDAWLGGMCAC
jgi:hypothetical protein